MASAKTENTVLRGVGASPGIVIGQARVTDRSRVAVVETLIDRDAIRHESGRFQRALAQVREDLLSLKRQLEAERGPEHLYVIDTHLMILDDAMLGSMQKRPSNGP
jgi:phosphoenolpyruvate-protein phosphotransferase (PTS system enzyme I)